MPKRVIDFTNVKDRGQFNPRHLPEGIYTAKITAFTDSVAKSSGNDMWTYTIQLTDHPSAIYPYRCTLTAESLWKIRNLLIACGIEVPKKRLNVDPERPVGKDVIVELEDDEYEGRPKSNVLNVYHIDDLKKFKAGKPIAVADEDDDEDDEEDEPTPAKRAAAKKTARRKPAPEPEDDEDDEDDEEEPPPPPRRKKKAAPPPPDDDDEEDEDEEPPPPRRKKRKPAPVDDDDEFDLEEV